MLDLIWIQIKFEVLVEALKAFFKKVHFEKTTTADNKKNIKFLACNKLMVKSCSLCIPDYLYKTVYL